MRGLAWDAAAPHSVTLREDLPVPKPRRGQSLIRVTHSTVNAHEFEAAADPFLRAGSWIRGARGPVRTGLEFSGLVTNDGPDFSEGDRVMGYVNMISGARPHADYVAIDDGLIAPVPTSATMAEASAIPMGGLTALDAVTKASPGGAGDLLVFGATGGVGLMAIQIARLLGATPVAVASKTHACELRRLGAADVIDYRETPVESMSGSFDGVLDFSNTKRLEDVRHLLADGARFIPADPLRRVLDIVRSRHARAVLVYKGDRSRLNQLAMWMDAGSLTAIVDAEYPLSQWSRAIQRAHTHGRIGRTVLSMHDDAPS